MLFNSMHFLIFFPVVLLLYYCLPKKIKSFWLLIASYYFYMCWDPRYGVLLLFATAVTYVGGLLLEREEGVDTPKRKGLVAANFVINLAILFYFKYVGFTLSLLSGFFRMLHVELNVPAFNILLPVGISFYLFQGLGYIMDVYRRKLPAEKNFFDYALFLAFFPQLLQGPIERAGNLLTQVRVPHDFDFEKIREGFLLMLWGYFLKLVLADRMTLFVDTVYTRYDLYGGWFLVVGTILFGLQIYCDFYGYSVIAMGASKMLGIELCENFDTPYLAASVGDFWRRWHISLTSWFRDYLYIPLGGSRKGNVRKQVNKMIVFLVSGLWHGASLSFVVWGGLNGLYQVLGELLMPLRDKMVRVLHLNRNSLAHRVVSSIVTFALVDFAWLFFRAGTLSASVGIIKEMISVHNVWVLFDGSLYTCGISAAGFRVMLAGLLLLLAADICKLKGICLRKVIIAQDYWFRYLFIAAAICVIVTFGIWGPGYSAANFIYLQF